MLNISSNMKYFAKYLSNDSEKYEICIGGRSGGRCYSMAVISKYEEEMRNDKDVHFLYKTTWDGKNLKDLDNSHVINILLMLERNVLKYKTNLELFLLDFKYDELIQAKYDLLEIANMNPTSWLESLPIYKALIEELNTRKLKGYYDIVRARKENENGEKNN